MEINAVVKPVLESISFCQRYKKIVDNNFDYENSFDDFENSEILKLLEEFGYKASYNKKEHFFKILESIPPFQFQFNLILKGGIMDLVWDLKKDGERLSLGGGVWSGIATRLLGTCERIKKPIFTSYENLHSMFIDVFGIYQDFKKEIIKRLI